VVGYVYSWNGLNSHSAFTLLIISFYIYLLCSSVSASLIPVMSSYALPKSHQDVGNPASCKEDAFDADSR
jgi:hypothetical protein